MQIISNIIDFDMGIQEAIEAPLGSIAREQKSASKTVSLKKYGPVRGYRPNCGCTGSYDLHFGGAQGVTFKDGKLYGGADPRRDGVAVGF